MATTKTLLQKKQDTKKAAQTKQLQKQAAEIRQNRRDGRGGLKEKGLLGVFGALSDVILNFFGGVETPGSAQATLPYVRMYKDGTCDIGKGLYSRTVQFYDINYQLSKDEQKSKIFNQYCALLNSIDPSVHIQLSFHNMLIDLDELKRAVEITAQEDELDSVRDGFSVYLKEQLEAGRNEFNRTKYITFSLQAEDIKDARIKLRRVEGGILHHLTSVMKVKAYSLRGKDRLRVMHEVMRDNPKDKFRYDFTEQAKAGLNSKDAIAPSSFDFRYADMFGVGDRWACASYLQIDASRVHDTLLSDFLDMEGAMMVNIHMRPVRQDKAIRTVKSKIADVDSMKAMQNKKAVEQGIDMDIMPTDINTYGAEARELLDGLQTKDEHYFLLTFIIINIADTKTKLKSLVEQAKSIAREHSCELKTFRFQQETAFQSVVPVGKIHVPVKRGIPTTGAGILIPFVAQDIYMQNGLHYGRNLLTQRMIMANRKDLTNTSALRLGVPGSGKSVDTKIEIAEVRLSTLDSGIIVDPEREYSPLVKLLGGKVLELSLGSNTYCNIMDINTDYNVDDTGKVGDPVSFKAIMLLDAFKKMMNGNMDYIQRSLVDRCIHLVYDEYFKNPKPENMPILGDVYQALSVQPEPEAQTVRAALEIYVHGSLSYFNHHTNIDMRRDEHGRTFMCFDIHQLEGDLKELGMTILSDYIWIMATTNRLLKKYTWVWYDEFHVLMRSVPDFCVNSWKRMRKMFCLPCGITQNVADFLNEPNGVDVSSILSNSSFIRMFEQTHSDALILSKFLDISEDEMKTVDSPPVGQGLMRCGGTILPFTNLIPKDNVLYPYITTKPGEGI